MIPIQLGAFQFTLKKKRLLVPAVTHVMYTLELFGIWAILVYTSPVFFAAHLGTALLLSTMRIELRVPKYILFASYCWVLSAFRKSMSEGAPVHRITLIL